MNSAKSCNCSRLKAWACPRVAVVLVAKKDRTSAPLGSVALRALGYRALLLQELGQERVQEQEQEQGHGQGLRLVLGAKTHLKTLRLPSPVWHPNFNNNSSSSRRRVDWLFKMCWIPNNSCRSSMLTLQFMPRSRESYPRASNLLET